MNKFRKIAGKAALVAATGALAFSALADNGSSGNCSGSQVACKVSAKCGSLSVDFTWCCSSEQCQVRKKSSGDAWSSATYGASLTYCEVETGCGS